MAGEQHDQGAEGGGGADGDHQTGLAGAVEVDDALEGFVGEAGGQPAVDEHAVAGGQPLDGDDPAGSPGSRGIAYDPATDTREHLDTLSRDLTNATRTTAAVALIAILPYREGASCFTGVADRNRS